MTNPPNQDACEQTSSAGGSVFLLAPETESHTLCTDTSALNGGRGISCLHGISEMHPVARARALLENGSEAQCGSRPKSENAGTLRKQSAGKIIRACCCQDELGKTKPQT